MSQHHDGPGLISTVIDIILVIVILACGGTLLYSAYTVVAGGVRKVTRWRRRHGRREL